MLNTGVSFALFTFNTVQIGLLKWLFFFSFFFHRFSHVKQSIIYYFFSFQIAIITIYIDCDLWKKKLKSGCFQVENTSNTHTYNICFETARANTEEIGKWPQERKVTDTFDEQRPANVSLCNNSVTSEPTEARRSRPSVTIGLGFRLIVSRVRFGVWKKNTRETRNLTRR